jgi:SRSO17 transposase
MVDQQIRDGIIFDWVGGDGLYGHNRTLREGLDDRKLFYVLDVHKDEKIFTECPQFTIPDRTHKRGRPTKKPKPTIDSTRLDQYIKELRDDDWTVEKRIRKTHKGWKELKVHTKYSFTNGILDQYSPSEYAYFQIQRYWVERTFDDAKNELGMSDYQVRKWNGWLDYFY